MDPSDGLSHEEIFDQVYQASAAEPSDGLSREELLRRSRGNLVDVILAQIGQVTLLQKELATATWQAQLLVDQRDAVIKYLEGVVESEKRFPCPQCLKYMVPDILRILITDPKDEVPDES